MKPLKRCANGCVAPPQYPSKMLCAACLEALTEKIHKICTQAKGAQEADRG